MEIARLNEDGVIVAIEPVALEDWVTDLARRQIRLPEAHDVAPMIGRYFWDQFRQTFRPL